MIENTLRFREPAAWLVLAVTVGSMVLAIARSGVAMVTLGTGAVAASQDIANSAMNLTLVVVIVALVCACLFVTPSTPRAVGLTKVAAIVVTVGTFLTLIAMIAGLSASAGALGVILEALGGLLDFILKLTASVVLWLMVRALGAGRLEPAEPAPAPAPAPAVEAPPEPEEEPQQAPSWRPSEASGSVWRTAAEAAEGAPAAGHGRPGAGAWQRVERPAAVEGDQPAEPGQ